MPSNNAMEPTAPPARRLIVGVRRRATGVVTLEQYGLVRIRHLLRPAPEYDGWRVNQRPPQVGDVGTLLDILHASGLPDRYVIESSGADGVTVWLGDFVAEELDPLGQQHQHQDHHRPQAELQPAAAGSRGWWEQKSYSWIIDRKHAPAAHSPATSRRPEADGAKQACPVVCAGRGAIRPPSRFQVHRVRSRTTSQRRGAAACPITKPTRYGRFAR
jgi:hypothetical protein